MIEKQSCQNVLFCGRRPHLLTTEMLNIPEIQHFRHFHALPLTDHLEDVEF